MRKKYVIILTSLLIVAVGLTWGLTYQKTIASSPDFEWGSKWKQLSDDKELGKISFSVNGEQVTERQVQSMREFLSAQKNDSGVDNAKKELIKNIVLVQEAKRRGIEVTTKEAEKFADEMKQGLTEEPPVEGRDEILDYISGTGMTVDQFLRKQFPTIRPV